MQSFPGQFGGMPPMGGFQQGGFGSLPPLGGPGMPGLMPSQPSSSMPNIHGPALVSLPELRIKPQEMALYERLFNECDPQHTGLVSGTAFKPLMTKSKLNKQILAGIWTLADKQRRKALDRENFAVALRLVALAQNGLPVSEGGLRQYTDVALPVFDGVGGGHPAQMQQQMQAPQHMSQPHMQPQMQQSTPAADFGAAASPAAAPAAPSSSEWAMTAEERQSYVGLFAQADEDRDGFVNAKEAKFFKQSGLDNKSLKHVWLLADQDKDNKLSPEEFSIAMHLTLKLRKGLPLPATLPSELSGKSVSAHRASGSVDLMAPPAQQATSGFEDFGPPRKTAASIDNGFQAHQPQMQQQQQHAYQPQMQQQPPLQIPRTVIQPTNFFPGGSAEAFVRTPGEEMDKWRELNRTYSTAQSTLHHQEDQLKGVRDQMSLFNTKMQILMEQVAKTGADYTNIQQAIADEQVKIEEKRAELARIDADNGGVLQKIQDARHELELKKQELKDVSQQIMDAHTSIPNIKKEIGEIDMQIAVTESHLQQARQAWKQVEDTKNTQAQILAARKDQAAKILREKAEVQEMLDTAQLELAKIKNEATVVKENIPLIHSSIADMRSDLKDLNELLDEERKNPTARAHVSINANGELQLGEAKKVAPPARAAAPAAARPSAASLGFGDDDDDFAVPDIQMPGFGAPAPSATKPAPPATAASSFGGFDDDFGSSSFGAPSQPPAKPAAHSTKSSMSFDDGDDFAVPDVNFGTPATAAKPPAASSKGAFDDGDDFAVPDVQFHAGPKSSGTAASSFGDFGDFDGPGAAANNSSSAANDPFATNEDWGADPFASASTPAAAAPPSLKTGLDDFGANPFASSGFSAPASSASSPKPAPPAAAPPAASPPPPSHLPPAAKALSSPRVGTPPAAPKPAAATVADDDDWSVPDGVPGGEDVKVDWAAGSHDDWGF